MSPIVRWHYGPAVIDAQLLLWVEAALMMDTAGPRAVVAAAADMARDPKVAEWDVPQVHDLLNVYETYAVQRLRGWHRARYGDLPVEGEWLSAVRNIVDGFTISGDCACEDLLDCEPEVQRRAEAVRSGECVGECDWATYLKLRDHLDAALDRICPGVGENGYGCCVYYWAYRGTSTI